MPHPPYQQTPPSHTEGSVDGTSCGVNSLGRGGLDLLSELLHVGHDALAVDAQVSNGILTVHHGTVILVEIRDVPKELPTVDSAVDEDSLVDVEGAQDGQNDDVAAHGDL